jgi:hypothetical protein
MNHTHQLQFVEKGGVKCSTLGCQVYYSEEQIIKILEQIANAPPNSLAAYNVVIVDYAGDPPIG